MVTHFQTDGQSASVAHVVTLARQLPGKLVVVVHTGSGVVTPLSGTSTGGVAIPEPPSPAEPDAPPVALPDDADPALPVEVPALPVEPEPVEPGLVVTGVPPEQTPTTDG
jgi:hypothetical protein